MAADHDELRKTLDHLRAQLDEMRQVDPAVAAQLDVTIGEAKAALAGPPIQPAEHRSIIKRLSSAVAKYEASHPSLAGNLGSLIDALSRTGI